MNKTTLIFTFFLKKLHKPTLIQMKKKKNKTRNTVTNNTTYKENTNIPKILTNILIKRPIGVAQE